MRHANGMTGEAVTSSMLAALCAVSLTTGCATDSASDAGPLVCDKGIWTGGYTVKYASDIEEIAGYSEIIADDSNDANLTIELLDDSLTDLSALGCLTSVEGKLSIHNNTSITSLTGLDNLAWVGDDLSIYNNPGLSDLAGLGSLASVEVILTITDNAGLVSLEGLSSFTSAGVDVRITQNDSLTDLGGLSALTSIGHGLFVTDNAVLPDCEVCELLDQLDSGPNPEAINVYGNLDDDCTSVPDDCP